MPPVVIAAGIGAAAGIGGAVMSGNATKKAANKAADVSLQTANMNNALARDIYDQNKGMMTPFVNNGLAASNQLNAMLGLGSGMTNSAGSAYIGPQAPTPNQNGQYPGAGMPMAPQGWQPGYEGELHYTQEPQYQASLGHMPYEDGNVPGAYGGAASGYGMAPQETPQGATASAGPAQPGSAQNAAFDTFRNSTGYQFRLGEGMNALNHGFAGSGSIKSGAAMKSALRYGQNFASNEFGQYAGLLQGQAGMGMSGASALAGVGQNFVGQTSANNNSAGTAAANAALMQGSANANMFGGIANALGQGVGSSYMYWGGGGGKPAATFGGGRS